MLPAHLIEVRRPVAQALRRGKPVVALESTLIAHGLPWPVNRATARATEEAVREAGAVPATIAVWQGRLVVGLADEEIDQLARATGILKASRRDLAVALYQQRTAATTVAASVFVAARCGIRVFATGGIGGVHRAGTGNPWDVSADLVELARHPVAVVCAGAKSLLDLRGTLEVLETLSVPVVGYGTDTFPAFYLRDSGEPLSLRVDSPEEAAAFLELHWTLPGAGVVLAQPLPQDEALSPRQFNRALHRAEREAVAAGIHGPALTPFLLRRLAELTDGRTLQANRALIVANARLAAQVARALSRG